MPLLLTWLTALLVNLVLIAAATRLPLLTPRGWIHAGALGTVLWGCLGWRGWSLAVLYLAAGSLVTRLGLQRKQELGIAEGRDGRRGPENVWGSAAAATVVAICITLVDNHGGDPALLAALRLAFVASFAAKLADTCGSEIGKRWGRRTLRITDLCQVAPGTEGAVSLEGTLAGLLGALLLAGAAAALGLLGSSAAELSGALGQVVAVAVLASLAESWIGSVAQVRLGWLSNEAVNGLMTTLAAALSLLVSLAR